MNMQYARAVVAREQAYRDRAGSRRRSCAELIARG